MPPAIIVDLSPETHRKLVDRAALNDRDLEQEIAMILDAAVLAEQPVRLGSLLASIGRECGGFDLDITRDKTVSEPMCFD